ncbi:beta-1,4-glucuronyltransferase 1-like isoform X2 [Euwallacea fornicatus]|uniref:beta-1,4-glucuronyltransferase 1-like isoform X2 n=1 Tax=Euwallacea fornicatus TaxID=995702 RepID=UPI00338DF293
MMKLRYVSLVITLSLFSVFILLLTHIETIRIANNIIQDTRGTPFRSPGAYLSALKPAQSAKGYCHLNFALPTELIYSEKNVSGTPELGQESPFRVLYNVVEGRLGDAEPQVTYVTHLTNDFIFYLPEVVSYWEGPISVAVYLPDGDPNFILEHILHFCYCVPGMSRLSLHLVFRKDFRPTYHSNKIMPPLTCDTRGLNKLQKSLKNSNHNGNTNKGKNEALDNWYPINVCRNAARQKSYTDYVMVCDTELMPSQGLASRFIDMTESYKCQESLQECKKRAFVIPVFEVESTEAIPKVKNELVQLIILEKAVYFHQFICGHCQKFPGLEQWIESDPGDVIRPLIETKREFPYQRWEPIYIGTKHEPMYFEKLSWEGFQDKMLQMLEMCLAGYKLIVLDGAFLVHWPGIKMAKRKDEPWRLPYVKQNQKSYNKLLNNITKKYHENSKCHSK